MSTQEQLFSSEDPANTLPDVYDEAEHSPGLFYEGENGRTDKYEHNEKAIEFLKNFLEKVKAVEKSKHFQRSEQQVVNDPYTWFKIQVPPRYFFSQKKLAESDKLPDWITVEWTEAKRLKKYYLENGHVPTAGFYFLINELYNYHCTKKEC